LQTTYPCKSEDKVQQDTHSGRKLVHQLVTTQAYVMLQ